MARSSRYKEDKILWKKIKAGDKDCFNSLFVGYYSELYYYLMKMVPDPDFIKDCIQEVFVRIWETRHTLAEVENVKAYLIVCLRRMVFVEKQKKAKKQAVEIVQIENSAFSFDVNEFEKQEEISDQARLVLLRAINSLTVRQRELIMLFFYHELTYPEIAQITGISVPAVRNLMSRSLIHLRESLGKASLSSVKNLCFLLFRSAESEFSL